MRGSFHGIGRVKQDDGIECDKRILVVVDDVTAFVPFKRTAVLLNGVSVHSAGKRFLPRISSGKTTFFPDEILGRVYRA